MPCLCLCTRGPLLNPGVGVGVGVSGRRDHNRPSIGQSETAIARLIGLCGHGNPDVTRNAAAALGNLAYCNLANQTTIGSHGGVVALVGLCREALSREGMQLPEASVSSHPLDSLLPSQSSSIMPYGSSTEPTQFAGVNVDVIENASAALSSLAAECDDNCARIAEAGGIEILVALTQCTCVSVVVMPSCSHCVRVCDVSLVCCCGGRAQL